MKTESEANVKIIFPLVQDEDGYPPFHEETMWAEKIADDQYKINQIPFFATGISDGDVVIARETSEGLLFESVVAKSGSKTIQVYCFDGESPNEELSQTLIPEIEAFGCEAELADVPAFFSVNIPIGVDFYEIYNYLAEFIEEEKIDFRFSDPEGGIDIFGSGS